MEDNKTEFRREGLPAFPVEEQEKENSSDSSTDDNQNGNDQSRTGDENKSAEPKRVPFHDDPEVQDYIKRQVDGIKTELEAKYGGDITSIKDALGKTQKDTTSSKIPRWFGGNQDQWDEYRGDLNANIAAAVKEARESTLSEIQNSSKKQQDAVQEATRFFNDEVKAIQGDKTLNPGGDKVDPNALLKCVMDNDLVDSKGRWNYRAGWRVLQASKPAAPAADNTDRKQLAAIEKDSGGGKGDDSKTAIPTNKTFETDRPW